MRKLSIYSMAGAFVFIAASLCLYAQPEQSNTNNPPISQPLVSEGTFALKLASSLKLGAPTTEEQAEDILASAGIAPKNGWIADYPMTPIIIGQVQEAVASVAGTEKLPMQRSDALRVFEDVKTDFGLAVVPASGSNPTGRGTNVPDATINNYYYDQGPPVITYYQPPWAYSYLYSYVPYPFFGTGFFFPGFFVLNDFAFFGHHHHFITNHFFDNRFHAFVRVNPRGTFVHGSVGFFPEHHGFASADFRRSGVFLLNRDSRVSGLRFAANRQFEMRSGNFGNRSFRTPMMGGNRNFNHSFGMQSGRSFGRFGGGFRSGGFGGFRGGGMGGFHGGGHR